MSLKEEDGAPLTSPPQKLWDGSVMRPQRGIYGEKKHVLPQASFHKR